MKRFIALTFTVLACGRVVGEPTRASAAIDACKIKIDQAVHKEAARLGEKRKFGFQLNSDDAKKEPATKWVAVSTGVFIIDEGYISNSGATMQVRDYAGACQIRNLKVTVP